MYQRNILMEQIINAHGIILHQDKCLLTLSYTTVQSNIRIIIFHMLELIVASEQNDSLYQFYSVL